MTHQRYLERYGERVEVLEPFYKRTRLGLMVLEGSTGRQTDGNGQRVSVDLPVQSIADLETHADEFGNEIVGVESDAGISIQAERAIEEYGLESFELVKGTEQELRREIDRALRNEEWIVLTGWTPHWMTRRWSLRFLEDPKGVFGETGKIHPIVRQGFQSSFPDVQTFLARFRLDDDQLGQLMIWNAQRDKSPYQNAKRWIRTHRDVVDDWLQED